MIDKTRRVKNEKGNFKNPDFYTSHPISENYLGTALKYYIDN